MNKYRIIFTLITAIFISNLQGFALPTEYKGNDLRTLFLNNKAIIYGINIRTFNAKDDNKNDIIEPELGEQTGTFINGIDRLDQLKDYGINTVHILPITPTGKAKSLGTAGSLYAASDFTTINPQLADKKSSLPLLKQATLFVNECHKRNIRVVIDLPSCGAYDLYLKNPDLFLLNSKQEPIVPADWTDVRLFKTQNADGSLNEDLFDMHKKFVDMVLAIGADGIRADVATIKPYEFWEKLIKYARQKDPNFLFLAEASDSWTQPAAKEAPFTNYQRLFDAGFDGYYGSYFNFKDWTSSSQQKAQVLKNQNLSSSNNKAIKKSVIGSFATHDELSPLITGNARLSEMMIWLNATLPLNPYYIDGFVTGDDYLYKYSNKKAETTYTDDDFYHVHRGKIDIFNNSRKPQGNNTDLEKTFKLSLELRQFADEAITNGSYTQLKANDKEVFAYSRNGKKGTVFVILNKNLNNKKANITVSVSKLQKGEYIIPIKFENAPQIEQGKIKINLSPGESVIFYIPHQK